MVAATALAVMASAAIARDDPLWARQKRAQEEGGRPPQFLERHRTFEHQQSRQPRRKGDDQDRSRRRPQRSADAFDCQRQMRWRIRSRSMRASWRPAAGRSLRTTNLKPGSKGENVAALIRRLEIEGYLPAGSVQGEAIYTEEVASAVARFQARHGLAADRTPRQADGCRNERFAVAPCRDAARQSSAHRAIFEGSRRPLHRRQCAGAPARDGQRQLPSIPATTSLPVSRRGRRRW